MALSVSPPHASLAPYEEVLLTLHFAPVRLDETTGFKSTAKAAVEYEEFSANVLIEASTEQVVGCHRSCASRSGTWHNLCRMAHACQQSRTNAGRSASAVDVPVTVCGHSGTTQSSHCANHSVRLTASFYVPTR